ncbi:hypothetical protein DIPPA_31699 [Diplonema papillatum]|nr:hypothetical protein DIPPA_31699 [Diplonema papillatum]
MGGKRAAENSGDGKRRKQGAYNSGSWGNTKTISPGQRGIIFTIDPYKEPQAIKEIKGLFSRYCAAASSPADDLALQADKCVSDLLHDSLKNAGSKLATLGDFLQTGCRGNLFYKLHPSTKATPNEIARSVVEGLQSSGKAETRFVYKMQPIFTTVAAHPEAIERDFVPKLNALASESVPAPLTKYAVVWTKKSCSNPAMDRTNISCSLARHLQTPNVMAAYKGPNTALIVSIYRSVACLGLIKGYDKYCEYNVHKLSRRAEADVPAARQEKLQVEPGDEGEEVEEVEEVEELDEAAEPPTALVNTAGNAHAKLLSWR